MVICSLEMVLLSFTLFTAHYVGSTVSMIIKTGVNVYVC